MDAFMPHWKNLAASILVASTCGVGFSQTTKPSASPSVEKPKPIPVSSYSSLITMTVVHSEAIVRAPIPLGTTSGKLEPIVAQRIKDISALATSNVGKTALVTFIVDSVTDNPVADAPDTTRPAQLPHTISGHIIWVSDLRFTKADRDMMTKLKADAAAKVSQAQTQIDAENRDVVYSDGAYGKKRANHAFVYNTRPAHPEIIQQLEDGITEINKDLQTNLVVIRNAAMPLRPVQTVTINTDDATCSSWANGSNHTMRGVIVEAHAKFFSGSHPIPVDQFVGTSRVITASNEAVSADPVAARADTLADATPTQILLKNPSGIGDTYVVMDCTVECHPIILPKAK